MKVDTITDNLANFSIFDYSLKCKIYCTKRFRSDKTHHD